MNSQDAQMYRTLAPSFYSLVLRALDAESGALIAQSSGRAFVKPQLLHVNGATSYILEGVIDATTCDVPSELQSVRPYHWNIETEVAETTEGKEDSLGPSGEHDNMEEKGEGKDEGQALIFKYVLDICSSSEEGVTLSRDTKKEEEERALIGSWNTEEEPERSERAKASRAKHVNSKDTETRGADEEALSDREKRRSMLPYLEPVFASESGASAHESIISEEQMANDVSTAKERAEEESKIFKSAREARAAQKERYEALEKEFLGVSES